MSEHEGHRVGAACGCHHGERQGHGEGGGHGGPHEEGEACCGAEGHEGHGETCCHEHGHAAPGSCGCHRGATCTCGHDRPAPFRRRFRTRAERIAALEAYLSALRAEAQAVEERLAALQARG